ncbi:MAG: PSD1 and planctomycete cytochrome C domain-containing protein [Planctomycetales bacterium]
MLMLRSAALGLLAALSSVEFAFAQSDPDSPPASAGVDFHTEIAPILQRHCARCHTGDEPKGGLSIATREQLLAGGDSGPAIVSGDAAQSELIARVAAEDASLRMPAEAPPLAREQIELLRRWIDGGAKWEAGFRFGSFPVAPLAPRRPEIPPAPVGSGLVNPVDRFLAPYFANHGVEPGPAVSDRLFARRAHLDLIGLLPSPERLVAFEKDATPGKRARLVRALLDDKHEYAVHWLTFWNDALRNAYRGTGYIDGGRRPITDWLYRSLHDNKSYDEFVRELASGAPGAEGFTLGIQWRGVVNASQRREMQAAQSIGQVFLGTNLKCASCHDSFVNQWTLRDAYGLAAVFADRPLEIHRCDRPTGATAEVAFLFPQLGKIDPQAPKQARMNQLAELLTHGENGRLSRTIVNRLWAILFGRGLVEPTDDMDQPPWHADLLDWLASDLAEHDYDLKRTLEILCTSRAYQMAAVGAPSPDAGDFVFRGPLVRRMTAEQFADAVSTVADSWPAQAAVKLPAPAEPVADDRERPRRVRAALVNDDALTRALGRPNREQVVTRRESIATTLQALELTNGETLNATLRGGAKRWLARDLEADALIDALYRHALGRGPDEAERETARELLGDPVGASGIEDLLWVLAMLPEFQLIY